MSNVCGSFTSLNRYEVLATFAMQCFDGKSDENIRSSVHSLQIET